jgi:hypothetical protein
VEARLADLQPYLIAWRLASARIISVANYGCLADARLMPAKYVNLDRSRENNVNKSIDYPGAAYHAGRLVSAGKACDGNVVAD